MRGFVLDVNIWISLIINGELEDIVNLVKDKKIILYSSETLVSELELVLNRSKIKRRLELSTDEYISLHHTICSIVIAIPQFTICSDPKDNYLLDLLYSSEAIYLVSGDRDLLSLKEIFPQIISFKEFRRLVF